jgi:hypothetical protein
VRHLLSKIVAGGLSAGVILLWWPLVFPSDTVESWLVRGVLWTLCFELMLHSFAPLEESLWRSRTARRVAAHAQAATAKIATKSPRKRHHGRMVIAAVALTVPVTLLATAPSHQLAPKRAAAVAQVRHVTEVKRVLRVERRTVTVPRATGDPAAAATPQAAGSTLGVRGGAERQAARRPAARGSSPRRTSGGSAHSGRRSSGSTHGTPAEPPSGTPSSGSSPGSGERASTPPVIEPQRREVASL